MGSDERALAPGTSSSDGTPITLADNIISEAPKRRSLFGKKTSAVVAASNNGDGVLAVSSGDGKSEEMGQKSNAVPEACKRIDVGEEDDELVRTKKGVAQPPGVSSLSLHELDEAGITPGGTAGAESEPSLPSSERPQTPAAITSNTTVSFGRFVIKVCSETGKLITVLNEGEQLPQSSSGTGGRVLCGEVPPMISFLSYIPYADFVDAPVPRSALRMTTTSATSRNSPNGTDDNSAVSLPQSVCPLARLLVGLVDTTFGGAIVANSTLLSTPQSAATRQSSVNTFPPYEGDMLLSQQQRGRSSETTTLAGQKRQRDGARGVAEDPDVDPPLNSSRPVSQQVSQPLLQSSSSGSVAVVAPSSGSPSLYSPGYPSAASTNGTAACLTDPVATSARLLHGASFATATTTSSPLPPSVIPRVIQEPVYITLRFEKSLAACYSVCAKVVPELKLGWSVHSTAMFYCNIFIRAHFFEDPSHRQSSGRRSSVASGSSRREGAISGSDEDNNKRLRTMDPVVLVTAAIFLATKTENFKTSLNELVGRVFDRPINRPEHTQYKSMVLQAEIMLLATLGGNLTMIHPFEDIRILSLGNHEVAKRANKLYSYTTMTPLALYVPRQQLAASLVILAAEEEGALHAAASTTPGAATFSQMLNGAPHGPSSSAPPVSLSAQHFEAVSACLSAMMLVCEKRAGIARLDNRVTTKKHLIAQSEMMRAVVAGLRR